LIALDTNALVRAFDGRLDSTTSVIHLRLAAKQVRLPPVVVAELLSFPVDPVVEDVLRRLPMLPLRRDYWARTGELRAWLRTFAVKAKLADCLIAQSCIDHDIPLITYDRDFRHFERAGLKLA
jgi:predicted nucleic acid-binding protein